MNMCMYCAAVMCRATSVHINMADDCICELIIFQE